MTVSARARTCSVAGCDKPHLRHGWCSRHWREFGTYRTCSLDECERPHFAYGYCRRHDRLNRLYGDPLATKYAPNIYGVRPDGVATITVTRLNGDQHTALYDARFTPLLREFTWFLSPGGYMNSTTGTRIDLRVTTLMHRLVLGLASDDPAVVDHRNGCRLDNRLVNLSIGTSQDNAVNRAVRNGKGTSQYRGVSWDKARQQWAAHVGLHYKLHHLGRFATEQEAAAAVASFRRENGLPTGY